MVKGVWKQLRKRALTYRNFSYQAVKHILEKGLDQEPNPQTIPFPVLPFHENIRGSEYYQENIKDIKGGNENVESHGFDCG